MQSIQKLCIHIQSIRKSPPHYSEYILIFLHTLCVAASTSWVYFIFTITTCNPIKNSVPIYNPFENPLLTTVSISLYSFTHSLCGSLNLVSLLHIHSIWQPQTLEFTSQSLNVAASTSWVYFQINQNLYFPKILPNPRKIL